MTPEERHAKARKRIGKLYWFYRPHVGEGNALYMVFDYDEYRAEFSAIFMSDPLSDMKDTFHISDGQGFVFYPVGNE